MFDRSRITFDSKVMRGQACISGMKISVSAIVKLMSNEKSRAEILSVHPDLEDEDISAALLYAA
jgi:uncharacterized protein (DUF433 family)